MAAVVVMGGLKSFWLKPRRLVARMLRGVTSVLVRWWGQSVLRAIATTIY